MASVLYLGLIILTLFAGEYYGNELFTNAAVVMVSINIFLMFAVFSAWLWFGLADKLYDMDTVELNRVVYSSNTSRFMMLGLVLTLTMCGMLFAAVMMVVCSFMMSWIQDDVRGYLNNGEKS